MSATKARLHGLPAMTKRFFIALVLVLLPTLAQAAQFSQEYEQCIEQADADTDSLIACDEQESARQDARLNQVYQQLMEALPEHRRPLLRESQRAWLLFKEADCKFRLNLDEGEAARLNASGCALSAINDRIDVLESELSLNSGMD